MRVSHRAGRDIYVQMFVQKRLMSIRETQQVEKDPVCVILFNDS